MDRLHKLFQKSLKKHLPIEKLIVKHVRDTAKTAGINLSEKQLQKLEKDIKKRKFERISISFSDEQLAESKLSQDEIAQIICLDENAAKSIMQKMEKAVDEAFQSAQSKAGRIFFNEWKDHTDEYLADQQAETQQVNESVQKLWEKPIKLLELLRVVCFDVGQTFNAEFRSRAFRQKDHVFEALTRLHARSCQLGSEIACLLKHGFADGANSRWRTLHEITVIMLFINKHGNNIAERYLYHSIITDYKDALQYQQHCKALGYYPLTKRQIARLEGRYRKLLNRFGSNYKSDYGWASPALGKLEPTFVDIEQDVQLSYVRPLYRLANQTVHAGSKGTRFPLGLPLSTKNILLAGPSTHGHVDPGRNTAISLSIATAELLVTRPNLDRLSVLSAILELRNEVAYAFDEAGTNPMFPLQRTKPKGDISLCPSIWCSNRTYL